MEDYVTSHGVDVMESNQSNVVPSEVLSPEDVAWADSCLANGNGISENAWDSWSSLSDALNETTISKPNPAPSMWEDISSAGRVFSTSQNIDATVDGIFTSITETAPPRWVDISTAGKGLSTSQNMDATVDGNFTSYPETAPSGWGDILSVGRGLSTSQNMDATVDGIFTSNPENDEFGGFEAITEENDLPSSKLNLKNVFRPTYNEDLKEGGSTSYDYEQSEASGHQQEESHEDIFKVWNLEMPTEDDEFVKQFNKAFPESTLGVSSLKDLENGSMDDVIRSMGDLSLNRVA